MATNSINACDAVLRASNPRLIVTAVTIGATGGSFTKLKNVAALSPSSIVLTPTVTGYTGTPTYTWYYANSLAPSTWVSLGVSATYTVTNTNYLSHKSTGTYVVYKCVATQTGWATTETTITLNYSQQSNDVPVAVLSKTSLSLPTTSADVVDYTASTCNIQVSIGGTNIPYAASGANSFSVAVSASNITAGTATTTTTTIANDTRSFGVMSAMTAGASTVGTITYTITARDIDNVATTITLVQTITKATTGATGYSATEVNMTSNSVTLNADATGAVTSFLNSGNTFTVKNGSTNFTYQSSGTAVNTFTISTGTPSNVTPGGWSGAGSTTATIGNITAMTANSSGYITFTINVYLTAGVATVFTRTQYFTQTYPGNISVSAYRLLSSTSLPSAPTISSGVGGGWQDANNTPYTGSPSAADGKWYASPPNTLATDLWCFQATGNRGPSGLYTWISPAFLATFKVGLLSALASKLGQVEIDTTGSLFSTGAAYLGSTPGYYMGYTGGAYKFSIGDGTNYLAWDGAALNIQAYTLYGKYSLGTDNILAVTRTLPTTVPVVYIRDNQVMSISSINATTDIITLGIGDSTKHFLTSPNTPIKFNFTGGGISSGTTYYVKTILTDKTFTISASSGGTLLNLTSTISNPGTLTFINSLTTKLMEINGNNTGAAIDVINTNDAGGAVGAYGYNSGTQASAVVLGWGATAINLVQGGIRFNDSFVTDPRTLDDYAEGTFTPTIATGVTGVTWGTKLGTYTKVGNLVTFSIYLSVTSVTTPAGDLIVTNLPFTVKNNGAQLTAYSVYVQSLNTSWSGNTGGAAWGSVQAASNSNSTNVYIRRVYQGNEITDMGLSCKAGSTFTISGSYLT